MQIIVYPKVSAGHSENAELLSPLLIELTPVPRESSFLEHILDIWPAAAVDQSVDRMDQLEYGHRADYLSFAQSFAPESRAVMGWVPISYNQRLADKLASISDLNSLLAIALLMMFQRKDVAEASIPDPLDSFMELFDEDGFEKLREIFCSFIECESTGHFSVAFDLKTAEYDREIRNWDWDLIKKNCEYNVSEREDGEMEGREFLGTVMAITPSGKYYLSFARSNVDDLDAALDTCFCEALEAIAEEHGGYIFNGEGDPCDIFFGMSIAPEDDED